jgi:broad-specificity NMP kinase
MLFMVLGAPGSGKSTIVPELVTQLDDFVVLDWDALMVPASQLASVDVWSSPETWPAYTELIRSVCEAVSPRPTVLLGVSTPDEVAGWPIAEWILLDCEDAERRSRLESRGESESEIGEALEDAAAHRLLGFRPIDTSGCTATEVAGRLSSLVRSLAG